MARFEPIVEAPAAVATPPRAPPAAPDWADLRVDLFSHLARGVLTLYAGSEQVLMQPFRFGKRSGLLRRQSGAGRLEARRRLPAGATEIRVYVAFPGRPTASQSIDLPLAGGSTTVLRVLVDSAGQLAVQID